MKYWLFFVLLLATLVMPIAGCGPNKRVETPQTPSAKPTAAPTNVSSSTNMKAPTPPLLQGKK